MVSRAYLNPQNAEVKANFRVFPGFMGVFWNLGWMELQIGSICCTYDRQTSKRMWCLYNRFGFPAVPVTKVRQTLLRCVDRRKNTSGRRKKRGPDFAGPPDCRSRSSTSTPRFDPLPGTQRR